MNNSTTSKFYFNLFKNKAPYEDKEKNKIFFKSKEKQAWWVDLEEFKELKNSTVNNLVDANMIFFSTTSTIFARSGRDFESTDWLVLLNSMKNPIFFKKSDSRKFLQKTF